MPYLDPTLGRYEDKTYSQSNEDGVIAYLTRALGISNGYFVEFGVGPPLGRDIEETGLEANCRLLLESGWSGLFMDGNQYPPGTGVRREFVTALNINPLLKRYAVPNEIDLFSIDVDGQDFWIWMNLAYRPKILIIEYNANFGIEVSKTVPFHPNFRWEGAGYYGASLTAFYKLGRSKGYTLVWSNGANAFFVRDELVENAADFQLDRLHVFWPQHAVESTWGVWVEV